MTLNLRRFRILMLASLVVCTATLAGCAASAPPAATAPPPTAARETPPAAAVETAVRVAAATADATATAAAADTQLLMVTISADQTDVPWDGQTTVIASASDPSGVASITVLLGDQVLATADDGDVSFQLIPGALEGVQPGTSLTLTAQAVDKAGNQGESTLNVRVMAPSAGTPSADDAAQTETPAQATTTSAVGPTATASAPTAAPGVTPSPQATAQPVPAATPQETSYRVTEITLPTYDYASFLSDTTDPVTSSYPLRVLDRAAYEASNPAPQPKKYRLLVLENAHLRLSILPDLGGRIYSCVFKPTGNNEFYSNPVVKPTEWGPPAPPYPAGANWWLALGGMEWGLPVEEHGYEWGSAWGFDHVRLDNGGVMITVFTRQGPQNPYAVVDIILPPDTAYFIIQPHVINPWAAPFRFKWWTNAALAPGKPNKPTADLRFILPVSEVTVHSTGDLSLPAVGQAMAWPVYNGRDMSRLGNWNQYLGVFERPAATGSYMGAYDPALDEGMLRIFPADVTRGAKIFAPGWASPIDPDEWTDDGSSYVELHGGLMPSFDAWYELPAGGEVTWSETWYPVARIGGVTYADGDAALSLAPANGKLRVGLFPTIAASGKLSISLPGVEPLVREVSISPAAPFVQELELPAAAPSQGEVAVTFTTTDGETLFEWRGNAALR